MRSFSLLALFLLGIPLWAQNTVTPPKGSPTEKQYPMILERDYEDLMQIYEKQAKLNKNDTQLESLSRTEKSSPSSTADSPRPVNDHASAPDLSSPYLEKLKKIQKSYTQKELGFLISALEEDSEAQIEEDRILWWLTHLNNKQFEGDKSQETSDQLRLKSDELTTFEAKQKRKSEVLADLKVIVKDSPKSVTQLSMDPYSFEYIKLLRSTIYHSK